MVETVAWSFIWRLKISISKAPVTGSKRLLQGTNPPGAFSILPETGSRIPSS